MSTATTAKERPILFSGPMIKAILEGRKSQTRRVMKRQPELYDGRMKWWPPGARYVPQIDEWAPACIWAQDKNPCDTGAAGIVDYCPYGRPGDRLWVRETWVAPYASKVREGMAIEYRATPIDEHRKWKPSIHMPRWASRITLEVTEVRVQRLQEISEEDARAVGFAPGWLNDGFGERLFGDEFTISSPGTYASAAGKFLLLWESIHGEGSSDLDPWTWAISFRRLEATP